ncbi:TIGR00289 family protein [Candidatus Micrarchaeota archaeon]|nr:MAG: TIGR00289 family protein [Candidatus Micrarchaeota archaeon]
MRTAVLFSGGKDSTYALFCAIQQGYDVKHLITLEPEPDSMMFHHPNIELTALQAQAIGLPLKKSKVKNENELEVLRQMLSESKPDAVVSGAVESEYQKQRIDLICEQLGVRSFAPLWKKKPLELLEEMIDEGFEIIVTAVAAEGVNENWLGRLLDKACLKELTELQKKHGVHPVFEGGEGETFVKYAPFFKKRIEIKKASRHWKGSSGTLKIEKAFLV